MIGSHVVNDLTGDVLVLDMTVPLTIDLVSESPPPQAPSPVNFDLTGWFAAAAEIQPPQVQPPQAPSPVNFNLTEWFVAAAAVHVGAPDTAQSFECPICLETGVVNHPEMTPCGHQFHYECLEGWLSSPTGRESCPTCRHPIHRDDPLPWQR